MSKKVKIIAILPLARFGFPHRENQSLEVDSKQADELIELGYAKEVGKKGVDSDKAAADVIKLT